MNPIDLIEKGQLRKSTPPFNVGDTVEVHMKIKEGDKERVQVFRGTVIRIRKGGSRASFTVRKVSYAVGVERIFPLHSPLIERVEVVQEGKVRRSRLYYLRRLTGKGARVKRKGTELAKKPGFPEADAKEEESTSPEAEPPQVEESNT
jgi:large subunit ribosomal protein L19